MDCEFLNSLSPIFRLKDVRIIWSGNVYKIGQTNCLHQRLLVIASPGIFLIRKKQFNFQSRIIASISFFDLISLHVTEQEVSFSSNQSQIRVKFQNTKDIVSLVVFIRQAQFPTDVLPLNFTFVNEETANLFTPSQLPYQPTSLFLDRMLSCICHFDIIPTDSLLSEIPTQFFRKYIIRKEMLQTILLPAWILSLSYDRDIEILRFESIKLSDFLNNSQFLFTYNKFVKTVEFEKVDFTNSDQILTNLFRQPHCFKPVNWVFIDCDLTNQNFNKFFNSISFIDKKINEINFKGCTFSEGVLIDIFQSIFFNDCFHSISSLQFNSNKIQYENNSIIYDIFLSQISEILCCSWVLQKKCLKNLSLNSSCVSDMTPILSQIFTFDTGLRSILLDGNNFTSPLKIVDESELNQPNSNSIQISFISFRNSKLSKSFVESLVSLMERGKVAFTGIDLSQVEIVDDDSFSKSLSEKDENNQNGHQPHNESEILPQIENENKEANEIFTQIENQNENQPQKESESEAPKPNMNQIESQTDNQGQNLGQNQSEFQVQVSGQAEDRSVDHSEVIAESVIENTSSNQGENIDQHVIIIENLNSSIQKNEIENEKQLNLDFLLNELMRVRMPSLEVIFFDGNSMSATQTIQFINFLRNQPNLKNLSICRSIDVKNSPFGFLSFVDYCSSQSILALSICGDSEKSNEFSYGLMNLNLIGQIESIECLDISNQKIGQKGLEMLLPLIIDGKLKEIYFDGSNVNSFHFLCRFCTTLLLSKIKYASFPENDFQRILRFNKNVNSVYLTMELGNDDDFVSSYENLKNQFKSHFYFSEYNCSDTIKNKALKKKEKKLSKEKTINNQIPSGINGSKLHQNMTEDTKFNSNNSGALCNNITDDIKIIENCIFNHKISNLYNECVENTNVEPSKTICSLVNAIQDSLSFDYLLDSL